MTSMTGRPCKPDGDLQKLWQTLMPGTPMPACGTGDAGHNSEKTPAEPPQEKPGDEEKPADATRE
jgi:hypothetical protein